MVVLTSSYEGPCLQDGHPSLADRDPVLVSGRCEGLGDVDRRVFVCLPIVTPRILRAMSERQSEFTSFKRIRIAMGTWNVNGGKQLRSNLLGTAELADWLLDAPRLSGAGPLGACSGFGKAEQTASSPRLDLSVAVTCEMWCLVSFRV